MIPNTQLRLVSSSPVAESAEFGISMNDTAHIMQILRDQLYTDKILAVLREYGSNAWDAHRDAGKPDLPIKVTLPTVAAPTLVIRDYGLGLSPDAVFRIFTKYGASTKRNSDNAVGMLGIGSKSGFAYSDSFTIVSYNGGTKRTYVAVLDPSEKGIINLLDEQPCGDETGVEISIAVRQPDIAAFEAKAREVYKYFVPRPNINTELPPLPPTQANLKHGVIYESEGHYRYRNGWVAVMGCVSYAIDFDQVSGIDATPEGGAAEFLRGISGALFFNIGEVQISASREELRYVDETKVALVRKFTALVDEYVKQSLEDILQEKYTPWERRVKAQVLAELKLPIPDDSKDLMSSNVGIKDKIPKGMVFTQNRMHCTSIAVREHTRFVLVDDKRALPGFQGLSFSNDYFVRAVDKEGRFRTANVQWPSLEVKLNDMINSLGMTGIPVIKLSSLAWQTPTRSGGKTINPKHRQRVFKFLPEEGYSKPWSDSWEAVDLEPSKDDVFVIIEGFKTQHFDIGEYYRADKLLADTFGATLPTIYAYKTSAKKPVEAKDCLGTEYTQWRKNFVIPLLTQQVRDQFALGMWVQVFKDSPNAWRMRRIDKRIYDKMVNALGENHTITLMVKNIYEGQLYFQQHKNLERALDALRNRHPDFNVDTSVAQKTIDYINKKYPLFTLEDCTIGEVWGDRSEDWVQYVKLIDKG